jgi:Tfp pilus assembly protein PilN
MRPVNLIPVEERSDARKPMRGGPLAYVIVGALLAGLGAVTLLVVTDNQISSRTTELAELRKQTTSAEARANRLSAYTQLHSISAQRTATVANLANSRFDWERVMRQLSLVLPSDVWLTNLTGTARPSVSVGGGESLQLRAAVRGPALSLVGCAAGQESVARFVTVLKDIDGVTRVGVQSSQLPSSDGGGGSSGSVSASGGCQTHNFIAQFQIVVAFDAAPIPAAATGEGAVAAAPEAAPEATPEGTESEATPTAAEGE